MICYRIFSSHKDTDFFVWSETEAEAEKKLRAYTDIADDDELYFDTCSGPEWDDDIEIK